MSKNSKKSLSKIILDQKNYLTISKPLIQRIGLERGVLLQLLVSMSEYAEGATKKADDDGWFYFTKERFKIYKINRNRLNNTIQYFERLKLLETKLFGVPAKTHFKINHDNISRLLEICFNKPDCRKQQTRVKKTTNQIAENNKLDSQKQQTNILYQNTIPNNTIVEVAVPTPTTEPKTNTVIDKESEMTEIIQGFARKNYGSPIRIDFGDSYLYKIGKLCDWDMDILKRKLEAYPSCPDSFLEGKGFSLKLLNHVWDNLVIVQEPQRATQNKKTTHFPQEVKKDDFRGKEGYLVVGENWNGDDEEIW